MEGQTHHVCETGGEVGHLLIVIVYECRSLQTVHSPKKLTQVSLDTPN
jgi:hypothetical protein